MKLNEIELANNYVLIKPDPDFEYVEVDGKYRIWIGRDVDDEGNDINEGKHVAISGTVIMLPPELEYHGYLLNNSKNYFTADQRQSMAQSSLEWDVDLEISEGAKVVFDYTQHRECSELNRVFDLDGYGECMAIPYGTIYGFLSDGPVQELNPINGYIFINRDKLPFEQEMQSGITVVNMNPAYLQYGSKFATVIKAAKPVRDYIGKRDCDYNISLNTGTRIALKPNRGFRIAYDMHATASLEDVEVIRMQSVLAIIEN